MTGGFMPRRLLGPWLLSAAVGGVGLVEGILFSARGRPLSAVLAIAVLGLIAWVVSPAAFPRSPSGRAVDEPAGAGGHIVVYWHPGCMYCLRLRWSLGRLARRATWVDIWPTRMRLPSYAESMTATRRSRPSSLRTQCAPIRRSGGCAGRCRRAERPHNRFQSAATRSQTEAPSSPGRGSSYGCGHPCWIGQNPHLVQCLS